MSRARSAGAVPSDEAGCLHERQESVPSLPCTGNLRLNAGGSARETDLQEGKFRHGALDQGSAGDLAETQRSQPS